MVSTASALQQLVSPLAGRSTEIREALNADFEMADTFMLKTMLAHWVMASTIMGVAHGYYLAGFIGGAIITGLAATAYHFLRGTIYSRLVMAVCLMLFSALFIQQSLGRIEYHFHVFGALAFLLRYKDIRPVVIAVVTIALHHLIFSYCQQFGVTVLGAPIVVFNYGTGLDIVFLHAAFVVFEAIFLVHITFQLTQQFCERTHEANENLEILDTLRHAISTKDLSARVSSSNTRADVVNQLLRMMTQNLATRQAMDMASTALIIADNDSVIADHNAAARRLFDEARQDYRDQGVDFDPAELVGERLDKFISERLVTGEPVPELRALENTTTYDLAVGERYYRVVVNPVVSDTGERLGGIYEWSDRTSEVMIEREVHDIVEAASRGDLSGRIPTDTHHDFYDVLAANMNQLVEVSEQVISDCSSALSALAAGDLTKVVEKQYEGQFGKLKSDVNSTINRLADVVSEIKSTASELDSNAAELERSNVDVSHSNHLQVEQLTEIASNMAEMTDSVMSSAENAQRADELTERASGHAKHGGKVIGEAVAAMSEVTEASAKIAEITSVIDEIAFQTNLLALNASVEAARAGEHGRGFAIVASEVRNLAGRSATAAKEISDLISDTLEKVSAGARMVDESGETLDKIVASVDEVRCAVAGIADAGQQQSEGIQKVNDAVSSMHAMTQGNSTLVDEAANAGQRMGRESRSLRELMSVFTVDSDASDDEIPVATQQRATGR